MNTDPTEALNAGQQFFASPLQQKQPYINPVEVAKNQPKTECPQCKEKSVVSDGYHLCGICELCGWHEPYDD